MNFVLKGLAGNADVNERVGNNDGWVSMYELGDYVRVETKSFIFQKHRERQTPRFHANLNLPDFALTQVSALPIVQPPEQPINVQPEVTPDKPPFDPFGGAQPPPRAEPDKPPFDPFG